MSALARRIGMESRPVPERLDCDEEQPEPERERDEAASLRREAEREQGFDRRPPEGEPSGEQRDPPVTERGRFARHRHRAMARGFVPAGLEQKARYEERRA